MIEKTPRECSQSILRVTNLGANYFNLKLQSQPEIANLGLGVRHMALATLVVVRQHDHFSQDRS